MSAPNPPVPPPKPTNWPDNFPWPIPPDFVFPTDAPVIIYQQQAPQVNPNPRVPRDPLDERFKLPLAKLPILGAEMKWPEWRLRVLTQLRALQALPMLANAAVTPERWDKIQSWLIQSVNDADFYILYHANSLKEGMEQLQRAHSSSDATTAMMTMQEIFQVKPNPNETAHSIMTRIKTLNSVLLSVNKGLPDELLATAMVKALNQVPAYESVTTTLTTVGKELTIENLQDAFASRPVPTIPGAFMASSSGASNPTPAQLSEMQHLQESMACVAREINNIKSRQNDPNWKPGRGKFTTKPGAPYKPIQPNPKKSFQHTGKPRQFTRPAQSTDRQVKCGNCGVPGHLPSNCRHPCGICKSDTHKAPVCKYNPHSKNFIPVSKRTNTIRRQGNPKHPQKKKGKANFVLSTVEDSDDEEDEEAYANMADGSLHHTAPFVPLPQFHSLLPPGFAMQATSADAPPPNVFHPQTVFNDQQAASRFLGKASSLSVLARDPETCLKWYTDGGATNHFTPVRSFLHNYVPDNPNNPVYVRVATLESVPRAGVGSIRVRTNIGGRIYLREIRGVWHVPSFGHSLISVNMFKASGVSHFSLPGDMSDYFVDDDLQQVWLISKFHKGLNMPDWELVLPSEPPDDTPVTSSAFMAENPFNFQHMLSDTPSAEAYRARLDAYVAKQRDDPTTIPGLRDDFDALPTANFGSRNVAVSQETPELWHQRLGHTNMRGLQNLVRKGKITGIKVPAHKLVTKPGTRCQVCIMGKHSRSPFHPKTERATEPMWALHTDHCGPYPVPTIGGGYYAQTLLDESSGRCGCSIQKKKSDGPDNLKRMILSWEAETGKKCHILYSDRGGEYIDGELKEWFLANRIKHIYSTPRTPEENGKAERLNRTLNDFVRCLLFQYNLYLPLWGHAMMYACLIYNAMWCERVGMSREQAFSGKIPDVSNFRTFGCKVFARVPDSARRKLDPKSQVGIFLGPETDGPGYKVLTYNPDLKRDKYQVRIFRDIVCYEDLKSVSGVQEISELHWGGHIPMPRNPDPVEHQPPELEPLTGVPEPSIRTIMPQFQPPPMVQGIGPEGSSFPSVVNPQLPGCSLQFQQHGLLHPQPVQGQLPIRSAGTGGSTVVQPLSAPSSQVELSRLTQPDPATHGGQVAARSSMEPQQLQLGSAATQQNPDALQLHAHTQLPTLNPNGTTKSVAPTSHPLTPVNEQPRSVPGITRVSFAHPITRIPQDASQTQAHVVPPQQPLPVTSQPIPRNPSGGDPFQNVRSNPIEKHIELARSPYLLRSRTGTAHNPSKSQNTGLPPGTAMYTSCEDFLRVDEVPFDASAFLANAPPFPQPKASKCGLKLPTPANLVDGLLRTFKVPPPADGKVYSLADAKGVTPPKTITEAMKTPLAKQWAEATVEEWLSIQQNNTWHLVDRKPWMKVIPCKWVYTVKVNEYGIPNRFKARLVAGGHRQVEGIDYDETYAPVSRHATLRTMFAVAAKRGWKVLQLDITTAFLHGKVDTKIYMRQPPGFIDGVEKVVELDKTLYGLKQSPRIWYKTLSNTLKSLGFLPVSADSSFWVKKDATAVVYLTSVVDDMLVTSSDESLTKEIITAILAVYPGKPLGEARHYNGMKINWNRRENHVILSQPAHILKIVEKYGHQYDFTIPRKLPMKPGLKLCKTGTSDHPNSPLLDTSVHEYRGLVSSCAYVAGCVRPEIAYVVNQCSRHSNAPTEAHLEVILDCIRYLIHTKDWGICLGAGSTLGKVVWKFIPEAVAYADANHGTGIDDKRSVSGMVLQVYGGPVSWSSKVQPITSSSTTEV
jgi:transposase InsO family protein